MIDQLMLELVFLSNEQSIVRWTDQKKTNDEEDDDHWSELILSAVKTTARLSITIYEHDKMRHRFDVVVVVIVYYIKLEVISLSHKKHSRKRNVI